MRRRLLGGEGPRGPRRRRWQSLREKRRRGIFLLPSLLTTANLFSGFLAVLLTSNRRYAEAAVAILAAILLDILDGKVARLTNTTTQFGLEFDSLADMVSFCVAPAYLLYAWALSPL
ncbi:MAG: CDP-alcohol phosphatidyltransferase family protein, partial [Candidatus Rokuibacteriota bacterium]